MLQYKKITLLPCTYSTIKVLNLNPTILALSGQMPGYLVRPFSGSYGRMDIFIQQKNTFLPPIFDNQ